MSYRFLSCLGNYSHDVGKYPNDAPRSIVLSCLERGVTGPCVAVSVYRPLNDKHLHLPSSVSSSLPSSLLIFLHLFRSVPLLKIVPLLAFLTNPELPLVAASATPFKLSLIMVVLLDPVLTKSSA